MAGRQELANDLAVLGEAPDPQTILVGRPTSETDRLGTESILEALFHAARLGVERFTFIRSEYGNPKYGIQT